MRVVILTSSSSGTAAECLRELCDSKKIEVIGAVVAGTPSTTWRKIRRKLRKIKSTGILGALNGIRMRAWYCTPSVHLKNVCDSRGIPYFNVSHVNSDDASLLLRDLRPDLVFSLGNNYIARRIFEIPKYGMVNVHGERLPNYQNAQSVIWPIYHGETKTGLTIHQIDAGIDTGAILYCEEFDIAFSRRIEDTVRNTIAITHARTPHAIRYVCENYIELSKNAIHQSTRRVYTTPSFSQYLRMVRNNARLHIASQRCANESHPVASH